MNQHNGVDSNVKPVIDEDDGEAKKKKFQRPPSSYGSMKSDSEEMEEDEEDHDQEVAEACFSFIPVMLPHSSAQEDTRLQMNRPDSPETLYTMTTLPTLPPGGVVIDTRSSDLGDRSEDTDEDLNEILVYHSPEPPEPVELDDAMLTDENNQLGRLHPEQDLPHIFKSIQSSLTDLTGEELFKFKVEFANWETEISLQQMMEGDLLDFVDRILEILGQDRALVHTMNTLEKINKKPESDELRNKCSRALFRCHLTQYLIRKHHVIREGVVRAGRHNLLNSVYVEPQISTCGNGGVDPSHEIRSRLLSPLQGLSADSFVGLNDLFRLQKADGQPVRTVLTTGIPGIGMSVSVGKFSLDWAEMRANRDLQFVIKLSFQRLWSLRSRNPFPTQKVSLMEVIEYYHPECKGMKYLEEEDCKFLIIMDCFDCYQAALDWEGAPVVNDSQTQANIDVLIVNIIRGTMLRHARVWILGRRAAVSQIPSEFIDVVTEIQGFSDEMKDSYLTKRFSNAELASKIVSHYKKLPTLSMLSRQPFICWMVATVFERCFLYRGYGERPPRLTPFYINFMIVQTNRRLQFYYDKAENDLKWSNADVQMLIRMGKMAFKMLEKNISVFYEEDVKQCDLMLTEVTVFSGLCTELPAAASDERRKYCFIHLTFQEFMAALYVFMMLRLESKNVLDSARLTVKKILKDSTKSAANLVQGALERTFSSSLGHYDMFLRFLCGLLSPECHNNQLSGYLYPRNFPKLDGLDEAEQLLKRAINKAQEKHRERMENLKECLREMSQEDE
ncbi:uncharacterized protein V6R79_014335 [Siganus canaliculatus]